jgi:hypothetical protein
VIDQLLFVEAIFETVRADVGGRLLRHRSQIQSRKAKVATTTATAATAAATALIQRSTSKSARAYRRVHRRHYRLHLVCSAMLQ